MIFCPSGTTLRNLNLVRIVSYLILIPNGYHGLVKDKKLLVVSAQGGIYRSGTPMAGYNFFEPYLRAIFGMIGITDISFIYADGLSMGDEAQDKSLTAAHAAIQSAIATW